MPRADHSETRDYRFRLYLSMGSPIGARDSISGTISTDTEAQAREIIDVLKRNTRDSSIYFHLEQVYELGSGFERQEPLASPAGPT